MADYLVVNGTAAAIDNINAGGADLPAYGYGITTGLLGTVVTLTDTELGALLANDGVIAVGVDSTDAQKAACAKILKLGKMPSKVTDDQ